MTHTSHTANSHLNLIESDAGNFMIIPMPQGEGKDMYIIAVAEEGEQLQTLCTNLTFNEAQEKAQKLIELGYLQL